LKFLKFIYIVVLSIVITLLTSQQLFAQQLDSQQSKFPNFADLVEHIAPGVVNISATRTPKNNRRTNVLENFFKGRAPSDQDDGATQSSSEGSGFIISSDGYVMTNRHVVTQADEIIVKINDGREFSAKIIGEDSGTDVALLKIEATNLPILKTGNSETLRVGEWVLGFGAPFGFEQTVTAGIVSAKRRTLGREQYVPYIQTDVAINPGNSGGPLVSLKGTVVGINSQILSRSGGYIGISFAIPIELALNVAEQFKKYGKVSRGYLGVQYQEVTYALANAFGLDKVEGALLNQVTKDSVAEKAGLRNGDIVLRFDGKPVRRAGELPFIVGLIMPGSMVNVDLVRDGKPLSLGLTVGERPVKTEEVTLQEADPKTDSLGIIVQDIDDEIRELIDSDGILVSRVERGPASRSGLQRRDIILAVGRTKIVSVKQFDKLVHSLPKGEGVALLVLRPPGIQRYLTLYIPE